MKALVLWVGRHGCRAKDVRHGRTIVAPVACEHIDDFAGTHRVQRIPRNDKRGRRHTSTATVAVVAKAREAPALDPADVDEIVSRGSGPGGQHRNKVETAITVTHRPTGISAHCESGRSRWSNQQEAWAVLTQRVADMARAEAAVDRNQERSGQIMSGERPVKSYTWNEQRGTVVCHDSGRSWQITQAFKGRF